MSRPTTFAFHFVNAEEASGYVPAERERRAQKRQETKPGGSDRA